MRSFSIYNLETIHENNYLCTVFFMVLDLRLTKDCGCRETTLSILNNHPTHRHSPSITIRIVGSLHFFLQSNIRFEQCNFFLKSEYRA